MWQIKSVPRMPDKNSLDEVKEEPFMNLNISTYFLFMMSLLPKSNAFLTK